VAAALAVAVSAARGQSAPTSGLDLATFDASIRPQDDLYRFVNGGWLARTEVPPERVSYGLFAELAEKADEDMRVIIDDIAAGRIKSRFGATPAQVVDLYRSMMNETLVDELGMAPIQAELDRIRTLATRRELAAEMGSLSTVAFGGPFAGAVGVNPRDPAEVVVQITPGGTLLPDRDYYISDEAPYVDVRAKYVDYLTRIFAVTALPYGAAEARNVLALETELARLQWPRAESRGGGRTSGVFSLWRLGDQMPGFDWVAWARPQRLDRAGTLVLEQPSFFKGFAALVASEPLETWRAWLAARFITAVAPYVHRAVADQRFEFFGRVLTGQELPRTRWKRAVSLVNGVLGNAVGRPYAERHLPAPAKTRVERLVANIVEAFRRAIADAAWLGPATRSQALHKLSTLEAKIGHPVEWRDYRGLVIKPDDLIGNIRRARQFDNGYRMDRLTRPPDRREWPVTPQSVNAYYNHSLNEIVLPAAILQPPLFDTEADDAVNYGGLGAIVGHEIGHAFDDRGRRFDWSGTIRNWWKMEDEREYLRRARMLVDQFNAYSPAAGLRVDGELTLAENFGDLTGLAIAHRAYTIARGGRPAATIDGYTGDQRFFLGWARAWRSVIRDEYLRQWTLSSPHALPEYRANGPVSNLQAFYDAFSVKPGDRLYRAEGDRIRIW
jgi:putative endopeptidase